MVKQVQLLLKYTSSLHFQLYILSAFKSDMVKQFCNTLPVTLLNIKTLLQNNFKTLLLYNLTFPSTEPLLPTGTEINCDL